MYIIGNDGKQKKIKGFIFDLDGTLLDSMSIWDTIGNDYLESLGISTKEDLSKTFKTMDLKQAADYYISVYKIEKSREEIMREIEGMIDSFYENKAQLKEGVYEFLKAMSGENIPMCIATATPREQVEKALKRNKVSEMFFEIITCFDVGKSKEHADIYEKALERICTDKEYCPVFEDAFHGLKTAKDAGFYVVGVYDPSETKAEEVKKTADMYINGFKELKYKK